jgi:hypothetical protein
MHCIATATLSGDKEDSTRQLSNFVIDSRAKRTLHRLDLPMLVSAVHNHNSFSSRPCDSDSNVFLFQ